MKRVKIITAALLAVLLTLISGGMPVFAQELAITDIEPEDEAYAPVQWVVDHGYMGNPGAFFPTGYVTRGEFADIIAGIIQRIGGNAGKLLNPVKPSFQDVLRDDPFYRQVETVKSYFITYKNSQGTYFRPYRYLTREEALMAVVRAFGYDSGNVPGIKTEADVSLKDMIEDSGKVNESAEKFVAIGIANELTDLRYSKGKLYFDPGRYITRGDLAVLIYNAYQKKELAKVAAPTWENTKISWLPVEHATKYEVNLYKDETLVRTITVTEGSNSYDFIKTIGINPGSYKATVQAKASNSLLDGPVSDPAARTFALSDFKLKDGEGITVTTDPVKKTHTITIDASKLPARLPKTFRICPILDDILPEYTVLDTAAYYKEHKLDGFAFTGRSGEYYRFDGGNKKYTILLLLDNDLDFLGYYACENPIKE
jgi:hypothetical protein